MSTEKANPFRFLRMRVLPPQEVGEALALIGNADVDRMVRISCAKLLGRGVSQGVEFPPLIMPRLMAGLTSGDNPLRRAESARALRFLEGNHLLVVAMAVYAAWRLELHLEARDAMRMAVENISGYEFDAFATLMRAAISRQHEHAECEDPSVEMAAALLREGRGAESDLNVEAVGMFVDSCCAIFLQRRAVT